MVNPPSTQARGDSLVSIAGFWTIQPEILDSKAVLSSHAGMKSNFATADLCDRELPGTQVADPIFRDFGGQRAFAGPVHTLKVFEDNTLVRRALETPGNGQVLVVDGGGSLRCALLGDQLGQLAVDNGWAGLVLFGCVRDSQALLRLPLGVKALATHPLKSIKAGEGRAQVEVRFAGVTFVPGHWLCADEDGLITLPEPPG